MAKKILSWEKSGIFFIIFSQINLLIATQQKMLWQQRIDPKQQINNPIYAKESYGITLKECEHKYDSNAKSKVFEGCVVNVCTK